jgi:hypothetical protein
MGERLMLHGSWPVPALALALLAMGLRAFFWAVSGYTSDDAYITAVHSRNLTLGNGPNPFPGVAVQGYSSPLTMLLEAAGEGLEIQGPNFLKAISVPVSGLTILLGWKVARQPGLLGLGALGALVYCLLLAVHPGLVRNGVIGLEGSVLAFALVGMLFAVGAQRPRLFGAVGALLVLTRPDAVLWVVAAGATHLAMRRFRFALLGTGPFAVLYAPWLVFSWIYYGSPVPQTVMAKSLIPQGL